MKRILISSLIPRLNSAQEEHITAEAVGTAEASGALDSPKPPDDRPF